MDHSKASYQLACAVGVCCIDKIANATMSECIHRLAKIRYPGLDDFLMDAFLLNHQLITVK